MADILKDRLSKKDYRRLVQIKNSHLNQFVAKFIEICNPSEIFVSDDSPKDIQFIRDEAIRTGEEKKLSTEGHTIHFDNYYDQGRDPKNTKFLVPKGVDLGPHISSTDREIGLTEINSLLKDIMKGRRLYIFFFCLGPTNSEFSLPSVQLTDSPYVIHNEILLYRTGYKEFCRLGNSQNFFKFVHSEGELESTLSKNIDKRRIYIDIYDDIVYSVNTQYGGNTIGHKKLSMRLAINRASKERNWLTEHMFLMGIHGPKGRVTYVAGAFPSLCGKTSTAMVKGETIVGDDIVYLRVRNNTMRAVNVEKGIFGIIQGINSKDDPAIWEVLNKKGEIIFSNVLLAKDGGVYWIGKDGEVPDKGFNHSGEWFVGKKDAEGKAIDPSHKNARFTIDLKELKNVDSQLDNPEGVAVGAIVYGGRDSETCVPVEESFDWTHGIITKGASIESETTAATIGTEGVRTFNPMANLEFLSIPLGMYIKNNLDFGKLLSNAPPIFSVNYFLKNSKGKFLNDIDDKKVWLKWIELRTHKDVEAIKTPMGFIPKYSDLKKLFKEVLNKDYSEENYFEQFKLRIPENLAKIDRITQIYKTKVFNTPDILFAVLQEQKKRLVTAKEEYGDYISPLKLEKS